MSLRHEISILLTRWYTGDLEERDVHEAAEEMWERQEWPDVEKTQDESIAVEALIQLDLLPSTWVTVEDVPAFLQFLSTPSGEALEGWRQWTEYWDRLDFDARRDAVKDNPIYSPVPVK